MTFGCKGQSGTIICAPFGYPIRFTEIKGHTHGCYGRSKQINDEVWTFLKDSWLEQEPRYQQCVVVK